MSSMIPPLTPRSRMPGGGTSRSYCRLLKSSGRPSSPATIRARARTWSGSWRRISPTCSRTPARSTAASIASVPARSSASGFSHRMCRPAAAAASTIARWWTDETATSTASTPGAAMASNGSANGVARPISSARRRAATPSTSPIATMRTSGAPAAMRRAWLLPMRPAPMTARPIRDVTRPPFAVRRLSWRPMVVDGREPAMVHGARRAARGGGRAHTSRPGPQPRRRLARTCQASSRSTVASCASRDGSSPRRDPRPSRRSPPRSG